MKAFREFFKTSEAKSKYQRWRQSKVSNMVEFDVKAIKAKAKKNYEDAWLETKGLLAKRGRSIFWNRTQGRTHPVSDMIWKLRQIILSYGFDEIINPEIVEESEVYRQYGPEAPVILDRCFYLAGLPRPELGLGGGKLQKIKEVIPNLTENETEELKRIFRAYKEGKIGGEDLVEEIVTKLRVKTEQATAVLALFPELMKLRPLPTRLVLRSHMTALWFPVLSRLQNVEVLPIKKFSIGVKYRREQKLDPFHLYASSVASLVVMNDEITLEDGEELTKAILLELGFKDAKFVVKKATGKYYAPQMEEEVFIKFKDQWVEVGDMGLYSPVSLANYDIKYPVFNVGLGVERITMIMHCVNDIRELMYPHFYLKKEYEDTELAQMIQVAEKPSTVEGEKILEAIINTAIQKADEPSPCEFLAYKGEMAGKKLEVFVYEPDNGAKLLGPAALNTIYVYNGNILGIPKAGMDNIPIIREARVRGVSTGIRYVDGVASLAVAKIERAVKDDQPLEINLRVKMVKLPSDVNLKINEIAEQYITAEHKKIMVKGPAFIGIKAKLTPKQ
ncbi:MAG: O-phosphoserine--tRNA ligase [Candidatus Bathyarchaeia archaeon]